MPSGVGQICKMYLRETVLYQEVSVSITKEGISTVAIFPEKSIALHVDRKLYEQ